MRTVVSGVAGFVGSHLAEALLDAGHDVLGIDSFTDFYDRQLKEANVLTVRENSRFRLIEGDLCQIDLPALLEGVDVVYHQAGQPGVRTSWGNDFVGYLHNNVQATQRLLGVAAQMTKPPRVVYASSSSVYGNLPFGQIKEDQLPRPVSPYGVTKLAAEHLCELYRENFGLQTVSLRYFTVYGPRQRPDMAFTRFIRAILTNQEITVFGDGTQSRDFTFVGDIVSANIAAGTQLGATGVFNIGGGENLTVNDVVGKLGRLLGVQPKVRYTDKQAGDVRFTRADTTRAANLVGYRPQYTFDEGLERQVAWATAVWGSGR